ncbi:MAG: phenylalanine--tRNA ligase subunit beta, partial [Bacteroidota bacterium]
MKISYNWLKRYVPTLPSSAKVANLLTNSGLEVSKVTPFEFLSKNLVIGKVLTCISHPDADRLKKTTVDIGGERPIDIVCGAANVAIGQKVIVAPVNTVLMMPDGKAVKIKKVKIRGQVSEGMICAEEEIGVPKTQEGILVLDTRYAAGTPAHVYFGICPDKIFDIDLTPNRTDALSHLGIARELGLISKKKIEEPIIKPLVASDMLGFQVAVEEASSCPRYTAVVLKKIKIGPSPIWLQNKLKAVKISAINNVVDVTNFVMHELGQPLHAFDFGRLASKKISVKKLPKDTVFTSLDGVARRLNGDELMICDKAGPIGMAGVIGGAHSKISATTKTILLESAYFKPSLISKASRYHKIHTESSFRFERGTDPNLPLL